MIFTIIHGVKRGAVDMSIAGATPAPVFTICLECARKLESMRD